MEQRKIVIIDAIIMSFFSYLYISQLPTDPTFFQRAVFTGIVFISVLFLMRFPLLGKVLQFWATIVWVMVIMVIVPFGDLTNDNPFWKAGIVAILFLIFLSLHGTLVQDTLDIFKKLNLRKLNFKILRLKKLNFRRLKKDAEHKTASSEKNSDENESFGNNSKSESKEIDLELFNGCNDKESLATRYRQLMKMYHPDNKNGDSRMTTKIRMTYDVLKKKF